MEERFDLITANKLLLAFKVCPPDANLIYIAGLIGCADMRFSGDSIKSLASVEESLERLAPSLAFLVSLNLLDYSDGHFSLNCNSEQYFRNLGPTSQSYLLDLKAAMNLSVFGDTINEYTQKFEQKIKETMEAIYQ